MNPEYRRMGLAEWMLQAQKMWMPRLLPQVKTRNLICKMEQIALFQIGFELVGPSDIVRGARQWYEMRQVL